MTLMALLMATGCGKEDEMKLQERAEARAAEARAHIDDLAARVGQTTEVLMDELIDCIPGQDDSGIDLIYQLGVDTEGDPEQIIDAVVEDMAGAGWDARRRPTDPGTVVALFAKDGFSMSARISTESGLATITGSGGCVQ